MIISIYLIHIYLSNLTRIFNPKFRNKGIIMNQEMQELDSSKTSEWISSFKCIDYMDESDCAHEIARYFQFVEPERPTQVTLNHQATKIIFPSNSLKISKSKIEKKRFKSIDQQYSNSISRIKLEIILFNSLHTLRETKQTLTSSIQWINISYPENQELSSPAKICVNQQKTGDDVSLYSHTPEGLDKDDQFSKLPAATQEGDFLCANFSKFGFVMALKNHNLQSKLTTEERKKMTVSADPDANAEKTDLSPNQLPEQNDKVDTNKFVVEKKDRDGYMSKQDKVAESTDQQTGKSVTKKNSKLTLYTLTELPMISQLSKEDMAVGNAPKKLAFFILDFLKQKGEFCCRKSVIEDNVDPRMLLETIDLKNIDSGRLYSILSEVALDEIKLHSGRAQKCLVLSMLSQASTFNNFLNLKQLNGIVQTNSKFDFHWGDDHPRTSRKELNLPFSKVKDGILLNTDKSWAYAFTQQAFLDTKRDVEMTNHQTMERINFIGLVNLQQVWIMETTKQIKLIPSENVSEQQVNNQLMVTQDIINSTVKIRLVDQIFLKYEAIIDLRDLVGIVVEMNHKQVDKDKNIYAQNANIASNFQSKHDVCDL